MPEPSTRFRPTVYLLFALSGFSALAYEVVWTRALTGILGNTVYALSTVLSVFMGGMAVGSVLAGRFADRVRAPLRMYALLQFGIGAAGVVLSFLLDHTGPLYVTIHGALGQRPLALALARYALVIALLAVPTTLMGATLPVLAKAVARVSSVIGTVVGRLYAVNTLGAAVGCGLSGFLLIGRAGVRETAWIASGICLLTGLAAWRLARYAVEPAQAPAPGEREDQSFPCAGPALRRVLMGTVAVAGFTVLGYEVLWTRLLVGFLGNSVYAFATMLTAFLTGLALGGWLASLFADRAKRLTLALGFVQAGIGIYVLMLLFLFNRNAEALARLTVRHVLWPGTAQMFARSFVLMLLPATLMGSVFPLAARLYAGDPRQVGRHVGDLSAANTVGAIVGAAATGFLGLPLLGLQQSLLVLLELNLILAAVLCAFDPGTPRRVRRLLALIVGGVAVVAVVAVPGGVFVRIRSFTRPGEKLIYSHEDPAATVSVWWRGPNRRLLVDYLDVAGTTREYVTSHKTLGHLPLLLHPNPRRVFILGFGAGGTAHAVSTHPEVNRIDAAEIVPGIIEVAPLFKDINGEITSDPRLHLAAADGRHSLLTTRETYDVISVDLFHPQTAGSGSLYTKEFYTLCHKRLADDGILAEWLAPHLVPARHFKTILRTLQSVFPYASLWFSPDHTHMIMLASEEPLRVDYQALARRMAYPPVGDELRDVRLDKPGALLSCFLMDGDRLRAFADMDGPLNTDNRPILEYELPHVTKLQNEDNIRALAPRKTSFLPRLRNADREARATIAKWERSSALVVQALVALCDDDPCLAWKLCQHATASNPEDTGAWKGAAHYRLACEAWRKAHGAARGPGAAARP